MHINADDINAGERCSAGVLLHGTVNCDTELGIFQTGSNIGVGARINIRIYTDRDTRFLSHATGYF